MMLQNSLPWGASASGSKLVQMLNGVPGGIKPRTSSLNDVRCCWNCGAERFPLFCTVLLSRHLCVWQDLGQIEYVFSDKTGTLTVNKMLFAKCAIGNASFDEVSPHRCACCLVVPT